nr:MAG TPA: hypothetical protein [Caudoviricetes sp.]
MTKQEFTERTGFTPTDGHFALIHEEYMEAGQNVGKDQFCKEWLRNGGPQRAYDWARLVGASVAADILTVMNERDDLSERMKSLVAKDTELVSENHKLVDRNNKLREVLLIAKVALENTNALDDDTIQLVRDRIKNELSNQ